MLSSQEEKFLLVLDEDSRPSFAIDHIGVIPAKLFDRLRAMGEDQPSHRLNYVALSRVLVKPI